MSVKRDFASRLKDLGIEICNAAKKEYEVVVSGAEKTLHKEKLKKRFNLENPYKFVLLDSGLRIKILDNWLAKHAKRYDEDDILVFFGDKKYNKFKPKQRIKDLSDETVMEIIELVDVSISVSLNNKEVDVPCTAVYGKIL
ncbi:hypothetical protein RJI07_04280 [Mycoplasmatota bacterium WC30]